ncbi:hypothetical protein V498_08570, partial [Pseudogymnoascus sp. VKM F-4517 (FW-2822)]
THVGDWYGDLKLSAVVDRDEDEDNKYPDIDILHVTAFCGEDEGLGLNTILDGNIKSRRRELFFRCNVNRLLLGDLTRRSVQDQALSLLRSLILLARNDTVQQRGRSIIFIAYDLGSLIVKMAISIAAKRRLEFPGIYASLECVVFVGCPQRSSSQRAMESNLSDFLLSRKEPSWSHMLTPSAIRGLADAVLESTEVFISSKITLSSCIVSLHANEAAEGTIHSTLDNYSATLGVPLEVVIEEQSTDHSELFPSLGAKICSKATQWAPDKTWVAAKQALLAVATPHRQFRGAASSASHPVLDLEEHKKWAMSKGHGLLYVHGTSSAAVVEAAEQILFSWQKSQKVDEGGRAKAFTFHFSSLDPLRNSAASMISTMMIQTFDGGSLAIDSDMLKDHYHLHNTWTEEDLFLVMKGGWWFSSSSGTLILLQDFDECNSQSRKRLLEFFNYQAVESEDRLKFLVTSREPASLIDELQDWPEINVDQLMVSNILPRNTTDGESFRNNPGDHHANDAWQKLASITYLSPDDYSKASIENGIKSLASMDKKVSDTLLKLLSEHSGWPEEPSARSLSRFNDLLRRISPISTTRSVLDLILRSHPEQEELRWVLKWLLSSYRPLTKWELAAILYHRQGSRPMPSSEPPQANLSGALSNLQIWLGGLAEFSNDQVVFQSHIQDLLQDAIGAEEYIWTDVKVAADLVILDFCLEYLSNQYIQKRLEKIFHNYCSQTELGSAEIMTPLMSDGLDILYYVIQALPHHISNNASGQKQIAELLMNPISPLTLWSKVWWAMSNPFARPKEAPQSAHSVLMGLGLIACKINQLTEELEPQVLISAARNKEKDILNQFQNSTKHYSMAILMDVLLAATQGGDEETAIAIANRALDFWKQYQKGDIHLSMASQIPWPRSLIWVVVWLNMDRLLAVLLNNGVNPNQQDITGIVYITPLYMASRHGSAAAVRTLLQHGAITTVLRAGKSTSLHTAAASGHRDVVRELVGKDRSLLEANQPVTPLALAALNGRWKTVDVLLQLGADPDAGIKPGPNNSWPPLCSAASWGQTKTVEVLLKGNADPNIRGPSDQDTPLWFAIIGGESIACCRSLLAGRADPNHTLLQPPLIVELMGSALSVDNILPIARILFDNERPINLNAADSYGVTGLMQASRKGEPALVGWLLDNGADINAVDSNDRSALFYGAEANHPAVVEELLKWSPDLLMTDHSNLSKTILQTAMDADNPLLVEMLLEAGADESQNTDSGSTLINLAVVSRKPEIVKILVKRKADINHPDRYGWSPVLDAVGFVRDEQLVRILVDSGANLQDTLENSGRGILHLAMSASPEILKILFEFHKAIDLDHRDKDENTPIMSIDSDINLDCLKLVIKAGADINVQNSDGYTPLTNAMIYESPKVHLDIFLSHPDVALEIYSRRYGGALHIACQRSNYELAAELIDHRANVNAEVPILGSTPLLAACTCTPMAGTSVDVANKIEDLVRLLVQHGADVSATVKAYHARFFSPLTAAAFRAGTGTINFLVTKGAPAAAALCSSEWRREPRGHLAVVSGPSDGRG